MGILDKMFGNTDGEIKDAQDQDPETQKIASFVRDRVEETRLNTSRISSEGIWMTNIAYLLGYDGLFFDTTTRQFRSTNRANTTIRRNRIHINKILPTVQNRLSRLCKNQPRFDVPPLSNDVEDKERARLDLKVLEDYWNKLGVNEKRIDLINWAQQCGHGYVKICYDDTLGQDLVDPSTQEMVSEGDLRLDIVSAFEVFPDPMAKDLDECQWVVHARVRKLDYFRQHYQEKGDLVKEEDVWLLSAQYQQRINSLNVRGQGQTGAQIMLKNCAIEMIYYERKSRKHRNGRMITVANGIVLDDKDLPCGEIPLVKFDDVRVSGKYYSESLITHLRPIQDQYNRTISQRAAWTNRLLAGKYIAAKGAGLSVETLNDQSGEVVQYDPVPNASEPHAMQIPVIPQYAYTEEDRLNAMNYEVSGIGEASRGQAPSASIPAIGMQFLMEQDDTRIGVVTEQHEHSWAKVGMLILKYAHAYIKTPRSLKSKSKSGDYEIKKWSGSDISQNPEVLVIRGSTLPGSKVLKRQEILNLYNQGLFGNPQDPKTSERVMGLLEFGDVADAWEDIAVDESQIQRSIDQIEAGQWSPDSVQELDNNELHIRKKNLLRKSDKFNKLSPQSQALLMQDIEARIQLLVDQATPGLKNEFQSIQDDINNYKQMPGEQNGPPMPPPGAPPGPPQGAPLGLPPMGRVQ